MEATTNHQSDVIEVFEDDSLPDLAKKCLCCLDFLKDKVGVVKIMDCFHEICHECFNRWKRIKDTCPLCRVKITKIRETEKELNKACGAESNFSFKLKLKFIDYYNSVEKEFKFVQEQVSEADVDLACLDHAYFQEELEKLTRLLVDVKRQRFEVRNAKGTDHEWTVLGQVEIQLDNLYLDNEDLMQFDIKQRLEEVYTMAETLFKIKTGKLENNADYLIFSDINNQEYDQYGEYEDYYEDEECYSEIATNFYEDEIYYTKKGKPFTNKKR